MITSFLLILCVAALAFYNGANDVSKGIATLVASGVSNDRRAIIWGSAWTVAGALTAAWVANGLIITFSGNGLISPIPTKQAFFLAVAMGSFVWVMLATRFGWPVSTTHAITGALVGSGLMEVGVQGLSWPVLAQKFALPLAASPFLSMLGIWILWPMLRMMLLEDKLLV